MVNDYQIKLLCHYSSFFDELSTGQTSSITSSVQSFLAEYALSVDLIVL